MELADAHVARALFGPREETLRRIEHELTVDIHARGQRVTITGDEIDTSVARSLLEQLYALSADGVTLSGADVGRAAEILRDAPGTRLTDIFRDAILTGTGNRQVTPKTLAQKNYVEAVRRRDVVFGIGPAGTGKTYLAMAVAISSLLRREVKRIVLTRPAVEAGERLGFLPGDLQEKVSPYLRPLYDALNDMLGFERAAQLVEKGVIEIAPLAFMRGRTLNASFVILDEAQNTTREQMKMFLTRLGYDSRAVITGDGSQIDLERKETSGLQHAVRLLEFVEGIEVCRFTEMDVMHHPLVKRIIAAYDQEQRELEANTVHEPSPPLTP
jgi:phosphate starvation-inducible PhoH-like protein